MTVMLTTIQIILRSSLFLFIFMASAKMELKAQQVNAASSEVKKNFFKVNLTALAIKNYSVQYERVLNKSFSVALAYRAMPSTTIPFKNAILNIIGDDDPGIKRTLETFKLSNSAITPEIRFYPGKKGYGRGFYLAPFYRYATFKTNDLNINYNDSTGSNTFIKLSGKLNSNTGGLLFGLQHSIGKNFVYDLWFFGPHIGSGSGNFIGISGSPLNANEQREIRNELENIDIPFTDKTINVNGNGASLKLSGPWGGLRAGLSLGLKF